MVNIYTSTCLERVLSGVMMGQQDAERRGKENGAITQLSSSKGTSLPQDLISEILLRVPAKSVAKSRCVSKLCSSITNLPCFIRSFAARSSKSACLVILLRDCDKLFVLSLLEDQNSNKNNPVVVDSYSMTYPKDYCFESTQSVNGLICIRSSGHPQIWNPTTRRFSNIPKPDRRWKSSLSFLGYDPIEGTYKVLSMPFTSYRKCSNHPRALTLGGGGAQESWRVIQGIPEHIPDGFGQCIDGVLYYTASPIHAINQFLVSFHVRSEKLTVIKVPWTFYFCFLIAYEGKLVCVSPKADDINMWTLEDAEKEEWSYKHLRLPFTCKERGSRTRMIHFSGVNDAGEFIYIPLHLGNPFQIIYFHPKANSFRTVVVMDDQFRLRNGLGDKPLYNVSNYTNHMDSFISF